MVVVSYWSTDSEGVKRVTNRLNFPAVGAESVIIIKNAKGKEVVRITRGYVTVKNFNVEEIVQVNICYLLRNERRIKRATYTYGFWGVWTSQFKYGVEQPTHFPIPASPPGFEPRTSWTLH